MSTVSIPDLRTEEPYEDTVEPGANLERLLDEPEDLPEVPMEAAEKLNLKNAAKIFADPVKHQNLTLVEVMLKRDTDSILAAMSRHYNYSR